VLWSEIELKTPLASLEPDALDYSGEVCEADVDTIGVAANALLQRSLIT